MRVLTTWGLRVELTNAEECGQNDDDAQQSHEEDWLPRLLAWGLGTPGWGLGASCLAAPTASAWRGSVRARMIVIAHEKFLSQVMAAWYRSQQQEDTDERLDTALGHSDAHAVEASRTLARHGLFVRGRRHEGRDPVCWRRSVCRRRPTWSVSAG